MNEHGIAPDCLVGPEPVIRIRDAHRTVVPTHAGYELRPNVDYRIEVVVRGVPADRFKVQVRQRPSYVMPSHSSECTEAGTRVLTMSTHGPTVADTWDPYGDDLVLTITYHDPDLGVSHVRVPVVPRRSWWSGLPYFATLVATWVWWCTVDRPAWLSADWARTFLVSVLVTATLAVVLLLLRRFYWQPWNRYAQLRRRAAERLPATE